MEVPTPLTILVDREIVLTEGDVLSLKAPWTVVTFASESTLPMPIVITSMRARVFDPIFFQIKEMDVLQLDGSLSNMGTIFPSGYDCINATNPDYKCEASLNSQQYYISDMVTYGNDGVFNDSIPMVYRGVSFDVLITMKGWFINADGEVEETTVLTKFETRSN